MYDTVLLTIDLNTEASWAKALPAALDIVRQSGGTLHILAVLPDFGMTIVRDFFPADFEAKAVEHAKGELDAFVAANVPEGVTCVPHLGHGDIHSVILKSAEDLQADLIVMASHPPDQLRTMFVGSNADWVVHRSPVSVLVVR